MTTQHRDAMAMEVGKAVESRVRDFLGKFTDEELPAVLDALESLLGDNDDSGDQAK